MKNLLFLLLVITLVSCKDSPTEKTIVKKEPLGSFSGKVVDENGIALKDVGITTNPHTIYTSSDSNGEFKGTDIDAGFYKLYAKLEGYNDQSADMVINDGKESVYDIVMSAIPPPEPIYSMTALRWSYFSSSSTFSHSLTYAVESSTFIGEFSAVMHYARSVTYGITTEYKVWEFEIQGERNGKFVKWASDGGSFKFEGEFTDEKHISGSLKVKLSTYKIDETKGITYEKRS